MPRIPIKAYEGSITLINKEKGTYEAELYDLDHPNHMIPSGIGTFPLDQLSPEERANLSVGQYLRWEIFDSHPLSTITFPVSRLTQEDIDEGKRWAESVQKALKLT